MRVFVTGASGWIGSAVTAELIAAGHEVVGLARSDASAAAIKAAGGEVRRGSITDHDSLRAAAEGVDGVIHTAFIHDFNSHEDAAAVDLAAVQLFGTGVAPVLASLLLADTRPDEPLAGYPLVAGVCLVIGLLAVYLGGLLRPALPREAEVEVGEPELSRPTTGCRTLESS